MPGLETRDFGRRQRVLASTASTNEDLLQWASEGAPHGTLVWAEAQTAGRGRQGREWLSEAGVGLYASLLIRPKRALEELAPFSLVTALAVAQVLEEVAKLKVRLKWPNDLVWRALKLGGILLEARSGGDPHLVVGIGLNLRPPAAGWPAPLRSRAVSIAESGRPVPEPGFLLAGILNRLESSWERFLQGGFSVFEAEWARRDLLAGKEAMVQEGARSYRVRVKGVDASGELVVVYDDGHDARLRAGEVHLLEEPGA